MGANVFPTTTDTILGESNALMASLAIKGALHESTVGFRTASTHSLLDHIGTYSDLHTCKVYLISDYQNLPKFMNN